MLKRSLAVLLISFSVLSCSHDSSADDPPFTLSPYGYFVYYQDQGSVATGRLTLDEIYLLHSQTIDRAVQELNREGVPLDEGYAMARSYNWLLVDNVAFIASDGRTWVTGEILRRHGQIWVAMYARVEGYTTAVPSDAPPWTIRIGFSGDVDWSRWGALDRNNAFPASKHELGHALLGRCYEHHCR